MCLRRNPDTHAVEVLMIERSQDDTAYPGQMHCPGTVMRSGESIEEMFERLSRKEVNARLYGQKFIGFDNNTAEARGHFLHLIHLVQVDDPNNGSWHPINDLPKNTVEHHRTIVIPTAVKAFMG
ncbi:MAG: NUDIX domain-containing protein [Patescibacteria group bacterium]